MISAVSLVWGNGRPVGGDWLYGGGLCHCRSGSHVRMIACWGAKPGSPVGGQRGPNYASLWTVIDFKKLSVFDYIMPNFCAVAFIIYEHKNISYKQLNI